MTFRFGRRLASVVVALTAATALLADAANAEPTESPARGKPTAAALRSCTGTRPITCTFDVAPGNYDVRVLLGSHHVAAETSVLAEARRQMLPAVSTKRGQVVERAFTVNVRVPESMPTGEEGTGTPGLTLTFNGPEPAVSGIGIAPATAEPVMYLAADSTVSDWLFGPKRGWGQALPQYFRAGVSIANYADSGESSVSWLARSTLFPTLKPLIRAGDYTLIQLAHNDKTTPEDRYVSNLTRLIDGVREQGGVPVLVTPPVRHLFAADGTITPTGRIVNSLGVDQPAVIRRLGAAEGLTVIDLTAMSQRLLEAMGEQASWSLYVGKQPDGSTDATHFNPDGARTLAGLVAQRIRDRGLPAAAYLR